MLNWSEQLLSVFCVEFLDNSTRLLVIVNWLRNIDPEKAICFLSCGDSSSTWLESFRFSATSPVEMRKWKINDGKYEKFCEEKYEETFLLKTIDKITRYDVKN